MISTAQGALEKQFRRAWNLLRLRTPPDNHPTGRTLHVLLVALAVDGRSESPRLIRLHASQLRPLFLNLIGSTIKYTDKAVNVESRAIPMDHPRQLLTAMDMVDTGVVVSEDHFHILNPFFQAGWATAQSGTGLGPSICRQYAELTGRILLEGTLATVSRFRLELPVRQGARKRTEELAGARRCITTGRVPRASRGGQRAGCRDANLVAATYLDELASASYGRARGCAPDPATGRRKGWQNCSSTRLSVWLSACRGVGTRFRSAPTHIVPARSLGRSGLAARCGVTVPRNPASVDRGTLPAEATATLLEELSNEPIDALILLDTEQIMGTVSSNPERDLAFGAVLAHRAARFAYTPILDPLQACVTNDAGG